MSPESNGNLDAQELQKIEEERLRRVAEARKAEADYLEAYTNYFYGSLEDDE